MLDIFGILFWQSACAFFFLVACFLGAGWATEFNRCKRAEDEAAMHKTSASIYRERYGRLLRDAIAADMERALKPGGTDDE